MSNSRKDGTISYLQGDMVSRGTKGHKLTPKMVSFIDAYFGDAMFDGAKAYGMSMYAGNDKNNKIRAYELMKHPLVNAEIERRMLARSEKSELTADYLITKLMGMIEAEEKRNPQAALRAIELAGKSIALWKERQEISGPDGAAIQHEQNIKESVVDFTTKLESLSGRVQPIASGNPSDDAGEGTTNVVKLPVRRGESGA